jgi:hypothetical protein
MALKTQYVPSRRLRNDFVDVDEAMFERVERHCEFILFILSIEKSDLDDFA